MDLAKQARRLYVGNCPPETSPAEVVRVRVRVRVRFRGQG
jgi:hypothetical protein